MLVLLETPNIIKKEKNKFVTGLLKYFE